MRVLTPCFGVCLAVAGCSGPAPGLVAGRVTFAGKPVTGGSVTFWPAAAAPVVAAVGPDGRYAATVPAGPAGVSVYNPDPRADAAERLAHGKPADDGPPPPAGWVKLPDKYARPADSGLSLTVAAGPQAFDLDLK